MYVAELNIDKKEINQYNKTNKVFKRKPSLKDYAVSALYMKNIFFPHDWVMHNKQILTFHDLQNPAIPLTQIIDAGTVDRLSPDEFYNQSQEATSNFKYLLKKCLEAKLHKLGIRWIKDEGLFVFIPVKKDSEGRWVPRIVQWTKTNKATRTVVDVKMDLKDKEKIYNLKCLAFRSRFECFDNEWFLMIKPDWIFLWKELSVCPFAFENIQWLKKTERNAQVFNHFNFILKYLQPNGPSLFPEFEDYRFLTIGEIEKFDFAPIVPDDIWIKQESNEAKKKLIDNEKIGLFGQ